ncbi:PPOX class F420-dependent oxidoreductase [Fodinicola acaciae]|uniref:PPOX class F420-dependent oxidoreductase n=1 Tax=Fodinicola acaciae TaxID=2681555 RepID=UPI0013D5060D|nr:PPOX class F420-dependent oxidoreductase [Fodinicola acaciae]
MAHRMTDEQWRQFVTDGTRTGKVATVRADGRPHVAPVWFDLDGDDLVFTTAADSLKGKALQRDPRISICVDDENPPYSFVIVEGTAKLSEDPDELLAWATRLGGRYMGTEAAEDYGKRNGVPGELLVRVHIDKVVARADIAS